MPLGKQVSIENCKKKKQFGKDGGFQLELHLRTLCCGNFFQEVGQGHDSDIKIMYMFDGWISLYNLQELVGH